MRSAWGRVALLPLLASLAAISTAAKASAATTFSLRGVEVAASSTKGRFAGEAGRGGVKAVWHAVVEHVPLGRGPSAITGGSFRLVSTRRGRSVGVVTGAVTGGTVALASQAPGCANQVYTVNGRLRTSRGLGALKVRLTHVRRRVLGRCVAYAAYVTGTVSLP